MRYLIPFVFLFFTGCSSFQEGFKKGFNESFLKSCMSGAMENGASEARAKAYCECAIEKAKKGQSPSDAAKACK